MQSTTTIMATSIRNEGSNRVELSRSTNAGRSTPVGTPPDEELIARVRWHEEPALATIYDRYSRLIYTIALRIVGDRKSSRRSDAGCFPGSLAIGRQLSAQR